LNRQDGGVSRPRVLVTSEGRGIDGLTVTTDGRSPEGTPAGFLPIPEDPSNVEFGGPTRSDLDITAGTSLDRVETTMIGHQPLAVPPVASEEQEGHRGGDQHEDH